MKRTMIFFFMAVFLATVLGGCVPPYQRNFTDRAKKAGFTEEQQLAAFYYTYRSYFSNEQKNSDGTVGYVPRYSVLKIEEVKKQLDKFLASLADALDPKDEESFRFLEEMHLRGELEHEEDVDRLLASRIHVVELNIKFRQLTGQVGDDEEENDRLTRYDAKNIYLVMNPRETFPFTTSLIEEARAKGILEPVEILKFFYHRKLDRKEPDLRNLGDLNAFVWKSKQEAIELVSYKIFSSHPQDNNCDYIEGTRVIGSKKESAPALKVFFPDPTDHGRAVIVVDTDQEGKDPGFGLPDLVEISNVQNAGAVIANRELLEKIFEEKPKEKRVIPPPPPAIHVEIARASSPVEIWEKASRPEGWLVPMKYKNENKSNFNIHIKFTKLPEGNAIAHANGFIEIEHIAKEWTGAMSDVSSSGSVWEYFHPQAIFAKKVKARVQSEDDTKKVQFIFEDGTIEEGFVTPGSNKFIEDEPYAISYTEGQNRWWIEKDPGSKVFGKRKQVAPIANTAGDYSTENEEDQ